MTAEHAQARAIPVKNIDRGPLSVDGCGMLESEATGHAADTGHTRALIDAGSLIEMPAAKAAAKDKE